MNLHRLPKIGKKKKRRIGRGYGSMRGGHTVGRGTKGQKSRTGYKAPGKVFEGGQNYLSRRIPKLRGFSRKFILARKQDFVINIEDLDDIPSGTKITEDFLRKAFSVSKSKKARFKILGAGDIKKKINIVGIETTKTAKQKIEKAGGTVSDI